jgi:hypothetical protein
MKTIDGITIDREFKNLIPAISDEERKQLEDNIVEHGGARDPLVVWVPNNWRPAGCTNPLAYSNPDSINDGSLDSSLAGVPAWYGDDGDTYFREDWPRTLLDGHNRHEICTRLGLEYSVEEMEFASRDEAADWIDRNQLGRRNLSRQDYKLLLGRRYNRAKKSEHDGGKGKERSGGQNARHSENTSERLAREHGVDEKTVRRAGQFQAAAEKLGIEKEIAAGKVTATEAEVVKAAKTMPPKPTIQQVEEARAELSAPRPRRRASKPAAEVFKAYPPTRCLEAVKFYGQEFLERCPSRSDELRAALVELIASCDATK